LNDSMDGLRVEDRTAHQSRLTWGSPRQKMDRRQPDQRRTGIFTSQESSWHRGTGAREDVQGAGEEQKKVAKGPNAAETGNKTLNSIRDWLSWTGYTCGGCGQWVCHRTLKQTLGGINEPIRAPTRSRFTTQSSRLEILPGQLTHQSHGPRNGYAYRNARPLDPWPADGWLLIDRRELKTGDQAQPWHWLPTATQTHRCPLAGGRT